MQSVNFKRDEAGCSARAMRFQKGIGYPHPRRPRGPDRKRRRTYQMTPKAYNAKVQNLSRINRPRTHEETRLLKVEIALATHRKESYRETARRVRCSHVHCWRVARKYRSGQLRMLSQDARELLALRDSLVSARKLNQPPRRRPESPDENIAETWREVREWKRKHTR